MKKQILLLLMVLLPMMVVFFTSCSKDEEEKTENIEDVKKDVKSNPEEDVRYYVKYEVKWTSTQWIKRTLKYMTDKGEQTSEFALAPSIDWEGTYGPMKKGFAAKITCNDDQYKSRRMRIYVSRDKEPFVVKAETSGTSAKYTIDF